MKTLSKVLGLADSEDVVGVGENYVIVGDRMRLTDRAPDSRQLSYGVSSSYEEYNPVLIGHEGIRKYREMRTDSQIRASLRVAKSPVLGARWYVEPASDKQQDVDIAKYIQDNLYNKMSTSWNQLLVEQLFMLDYGWYAFEKVFDIVGGLVKWRKFVSIHPLDVAEIEYANDGGLKELTVIDQGFDEVRIPIEKLLIFTFDKEGGDIEGMSILRSVYKHHYMKEILIKIDAIQKERHGIGVPVIKLPPSYVKKDIAAAHTIGRNLRGNESAHIVLPPMWEIEFANLGGNNVDIIESIRYHGHMIFENVLADFLGYSFSGRATSNPSRDDMFLKASRFIAGIVADVWNKYAIPQLVDWNWNVDKYPQLKVRHLGDTVDHRTLSFALRNYVGAGILEPDDPLEDWIREQTDLPRRDPDTTREVESPQMPKQSTASNQRIKPSADEGRDASGG